MNYNSKELPNITPLELIEICYDEARIIAGDDNAMKLAEEAVEEFMSYYRMDGKELPLR